MIKIIETLYCEDHDRLFDRREGCCIECLLEDSETIFTYLDHKNKLRPKDLQNKLF